MTMTKTIESLPCAYCSEDVTWNGRVWEDETQGDVCRGDYYDVNLGGVHRVFQPLIGIGGVCLDYVETGEDEGYGQVCARCFFPSKSHTREPRPLENTTQTAKQLIEYTTDL